MDSPAPAPGIIEIRIARIEALFTSLDPAPFRERDLDLDAEAFILGWVANWKPLEVFLYDWWPIRRLDALPGRIEAATVEIA